MNTSEKQLWRATCLNTLISICLFAALLGLLWGAEYLFEGLKLLKWNDVAWVVGIPASIIGVAYILSIKNPENYTGFYAGILMSALLGVQFCLQRQYDSTFLYFCVFIPFQVKSIINWKKQPDPAQSAHESFAPEFLNMKNMLLSLAVFIGIIVADYLIATYLLQRNQLADNWTIKLLNASMIASSVLANFWLIYRKNDSWIYWFVYSVAGIGLFIVLNNIFSIVLFAFFLVINSTAGIVWIRTTPSQNYGWISGK